MSREPIEIIELDLDYCSLTYGSSPCTAVLGTTGEFKCFNTFFSCQDQANYDKTSKTYRFTQPRPSYPKGALYFPYLKSSSGRSATANIAGSDESLDSLGRRATISATFYDAPYHDRGIDKYAPERLSGAAQSSAVGYNPADVGTFWTKLKSRNQNYAGRPIRQLTGYIEDGVLSIDKTRHFIITGINGPDSNGKVTVKGKDVLSLASNDKAVAPAANLGQLGGPVTSLAGQSFTLTPSGIGNSEYETSGYAAIGSELVYFTRSGDVVTLTQRGLNGTQAADHDVDDSFQQSFSPRLSRIDTVIRDLLLIAGVDSSFIPFTDWQAECDRWASTLFLTADIMKPEGVSGLIGELAILGVTIWWDELDQEIKLRINRPIDKETPIEINDSDNIIGITQDDNDEDRLTEILFSTVQIDPSKGVSKDNFTRSRLTVDATSKLANSYGDTRIKEIFCRWLNHGSDSLVRILSIRLLNRFKIQPIRYVIEADVKDDLSVVDVVELTSRVITEVDGNLKPQLTQVIMREDMDIGHSVKFTVQRFQFDQRYGFITEDSRPDYPSSTDAQKLRGAYISDATLKFGDGGEAYKFI